MLEMTVDRLNRYMLHKQHLDERFRATTLDEAVRDAGGLHATGALAPYLSLLARMQGFTADTLNSALGPGGGYLRMRCVRQTLYVIPKDLAPAMFVATRRLVTGQMDKYLQYYGVTEDEYRDVAARLKEALRGTSMTIAQLKDALDAPPRLTYIVSSLCDTGFLVRGVTTTGWRGLSYAYRLFEDQFAGLDLSGISEEEAVKKVLRFYLQALGPATEGDIKWWTGLNQAEIRPALKGLSAELTEVHVPELDQRMLAPRSILKTEIPEAGSSPQVGLLPVLDPYIMGYKDRRRFLDDRWAPYVFDRGGNATSTILVDGRVAGVWDTSGAPEGLVKVFFFEEPGRAVLRKVEEAAAEVVRFMGGREARVDRVKAMAPLPERTYGSMIFPLSKPR